MILRELVVGPFASNCFIVASRETREGMIIDPGADAERIIEAVRELGLSISMIVVTHNHIDHVGALGDVKTALGADYVVHEAEPGINTTTGTFTRMFGSVMGKSTEPPPEPDKLLKEGDVLEVGDMKFNVLHTPGHTPGGISIVSDGIVFSGDTLFNFGIGRTDMPGGSYELIIDSIVQKLMVLPDDTVVYPGHGPRTTIGSERKMNPFL